MTIPEYPLLGANEIMTFLGWSEGKFYRKLPRLIKAGRLWYEWHGKPPRKKLKSYPSLLMEFQVRQALKGEVL